MARKSLEEKFAKQVKVYQTYLSSVFYELKLCKDGTIIGYFKDSPYLAKTYTWNYFWVHAKHQNFAIDEITDPMYGIRFDDDGVIELEDYIEQDEDGIFDYSSEIAQYEEDHNPW